MVGALSGYQHKTLTISPPPADQVVLRRLSFAVRIAEGSIAPAALENIRFRFGNIVLFFNTTLRSIRDNDAIKAFLSNITGGNTREVIELVTAFFGSPNVDSEKIVRIEDAEGNYRVPLHEFTKHALLGEYAYYNPHSSFVACNIFDLSIADPREHFLSGLIVSYLTSNIGIRDNDGFLTGDALIAEMTKNGFVPDQIHHCLRRLAVKKLVETSHSRYREIEVPEGKSPSQFLYRATSVGVYHIRFWTGSFAFLDAMSTDTPTLDEETRSLVSELASSFSIADRYRKVIRFRSYLENQWNISNIGANYYDFMALLRQGEGSFESVKTQVDKLNRTGFARPRGKPNHSRSSGRS
jgi:hypothetical protein